MSCPFFYPQAQSPADSVSIPARIPLGLLYQGTCHADPATERTPPDGAAGDSCNFGYGHGSCANFPGDAEADAVRFSLSSTGELVWILEKDCAPVRHGHMDDAGKIVRRQAEVFLENYDRYIKRTPGSGIDF
jgi:hypothetical protein